MKTIFRKIVALICVMALCVGMIPATASAVDSYTGKLSVTGAQITTTNIAHIYLKGTDTYLSGNGEDWDSSAVKLNASSDDANSGIFVNGEKQSGGLLKRYNGTNNYYFAEGFTATAAGDVVTIKGTFYSQDGAAAITYEESTFLWTGEKWVDCYSGHLTAGTTANASAFYMTGTDAYKTAYANNGEWENSTMMPADDDEASGVLVDGIRVNNYWYCSGNSITETYLHLKKISDSSNSYYIENIPDVKEGSVLTIKGTFYVYGNWKETNQFDPTPVVFEKSQFQWDGTKWVDYIEVVNYPGVLTYTTRGGDASCVYLDTTDEKPTLSWDNQLKALNSESGIYVNGTKIADAYLKKIDIYAHYVSNFGTLNAGDILTIKGLFGYSGEYETVSFEKTSFQWDGSAWSNYTLATYNGTLGLIGAETSNDNSALLYLKGTDEYLKDNTSSWTGLPEEKLVANSTDANSGIWLGETKQTGAFLKKYSGSNNLYLAEGFSTPSTGDVVTIKGTFYSEDGISAVTFEEGKFEWNGSNWVVYFELASYSGTLTTVGAETSNDNSALLYLKGTDEYLKDNTSSWTGLPEEKLVANSTDANSGIWLGETKQTGAFLKKYSGSNNLYLAEGFSTPSTGDVVTIKGTFYSQDGLSAVTFEECKFQWNGTQWVDYVEIINYPGVLTYTTREGTATNVYLDTTDTMPTIDWDQPLTALNGDSGIYVNGTRKPEALLKRVDMAAYFVENFGTLNAGDVLKIKGLFGYSTNNETVSFEEAQFQWTGSAWKNYVELASYSGSLTTIGAENTTNQNLLYLKGDDEYLKDNTSSWTGLPEEKLVADSTDANSGIWLNGTKQENAFMKKYAGSKNLYIAEGFSTPATGDIVKIVGTFYSQDGLSKVTYEEGKFMWSGTNWIDYVESSEYTATEVTLNGLHYTGIMYDEANGQWKMYFTLSNNIPGDANDTYYPYMIYSVNGTEYITHLTKSTYTVDGTTYDSLYLNIPSKVLPQTLAEDTEYTITLKAGSSQGRNNSTGAAREDGINLTKDFSFIVGTSHESFAPAIDYVTAGGGTADGIYLSTTDTFPTTGWDAQLKKVGENSGIYKYNASTDTYVETEVFIKKYADNKYYVCLSDVGESAEEGTIVMLKGTFTFAGLYEVTFKTAKYIYTGEAWKTYTATADTEEDVEWYGDATGDATTAEDINSIDLVRIMRYLAQEEEEIQAANADLNSSGNIDEHDENMMRWLLVNGTTYFVNGSNIKGAPSYADTLEMRLAAYISPDANGDFQLYKDAGFTTLMGEGTGRAIYGNAGLNSDGLDAYMQKAKQYDLDVLVVSSSIQDMLAGTLDVNPTTIKNAYKDLSDTYGDTFRGFFMLDEPEYSQLESHTKVLNVLNSLNAEQGKDIFTSFLPTYTDDDSVLWNDTSLSLDEKYAKYADAYGNLFGEFVYDFYPFKHKITGSWFWQTEDDSIRQDWFNNLELSAQAGHGNFKTGITVQSHATGALASQEKDYYRDITEADISFQVYSALAYGMKSIQYFTYDEHWDETVGTKNSMIFDGETTAIYNAVKAVNTEIKAIDHILLNYNWQGTIGISVDDEDNIMDSVVSYTSPRISSYSATNDAIIGCLKDVNGYDGFMLVHVTDPAENKGSIDMSVTFNNATHAKVYIDGVESTVALTNGQYSATLTPGQGIFVIPYIAE